VHYFAICGFLVRGSLNLKISLSVPLFVGDLVQFFAWDGVSRCGFKGLAFHVVFTRLFVEDPRSLIIFVAYGQFCQFVIA
jgi:hypothetical protein